MADYQLQVTGEELDQLNSQQPGRNILINGDKRVNQRVFSGDWSTLSDGEYGYDRWKKAGSNMVQIVESGTFIRGAVYTLSGAGVSETQVTSPASGNWTIAVSQSANNIKLEYGGYATKFISENIAESFAKCARYFYRLFANQVNASSGASSFKSYSSGSFYIGFNVQFPSQMRTTPVVTYTTYTEDNCNFSDILGTPVGATIRVNPISSGPYRIYNGVFTADAEL